MFLPSNFLKKYKNIGIFFVLIFFLFTLRSFLIYFFVDFSKNLTFSSSLQKKLKKMEGKNLLLRLEIERLSNLKEENKRLRRALRALGNTSCGGDLIYREIIGFSPSLWRREVYIEKSKEIKKGDLALNKDGYLVGKVTYIDKKFGVVTLLNDPQFFLPVFIEDKGRALLKGGLRNRLKMLYVEEEQGVKEGDRVWVKDEKINLPIYVGKIAKVKKTLDSFFLDVEVEPFASLSLIKEVFILYGEN